MKVLVIDDSPDVAEVVALCFEIRWPSTIILSAPDGEKGLELLAREQPDMVILDIGLPGMDGFQVCREIRRISQVPVIMLTVRDEDTDKARGLELGADDYITKPFSHIEFLARVQAVLRRVQATAVGEEEAPFVSGDLRVDFASREVWLKDRRIRLTPIEFNILYHLVKSAGHVVPHKVLLARVWGPEYTDATNYLKVHIQHLRQKLGDDPANPKMIVTEWKTGYKFLKPPASARAESEKLAQK
ncbi:MAG: response regulator transcription factor [Chloroflexi bacterium]|nr:response regulator transcription factor [Chloroflexota bacterium]